MRGRGRRVAVGGFVTVAAAMGAVVPAQAATTCARGADGVVTVTMTANGDTASLRVSGTAIHVGGAACGTATTANTETIRITGAAGRQNVLLDLSGGRFGPGITAEGDGTSEIEVAADLRTGTDRLTLRGGSAADRLVFGAGGASTTPDADLDVTLIGVEERYAEGHGGGDVLSGAGGFGTGGVVPTRVNLDGGDGADTITGGAGSDALSGGPANDTLQGGAEGSDTLFGQDGADTLRGGSDGDRLYGGPGNDMLEGGLGNDSAIAEPVADGADVFRGGPGRDTAEYWARTAPLRVDLDGVADDGASGEGDDVEGDVEGIVGGTGADVLVGNAAANLLTGAAGNDQLRGGGERDMVYGGDGDDTLHGEGDDDYLVGDAGNDVLTGGLEGDMLSGGTGNDRMWAGAGNDVFVDWSPTADGADVISGGSGTDGMSYQGRTRGVVVDADGVADDGDAVAGERDDVRPDVEMLTGTDHADRLTGSSADDVLTGMGGNDVLTGGAGTDSIGGGLGADRLVGGDGEDMLWGEAGNDDIQARDGSTDAINGGSGTDTATTDASDLVSEVP